jgi:hypothetical protein
LKTFPFPENLDLFKLISTIVGLILTWRNLEGYPAQPGLTWWNLEDYPAQPGLTWRNLEGYPAQPGLIHSSIYHSVHPSVRAKRGIWSKRVFMRTNGNFFLAWFEGIL